MSLIRSIFARYSEKSRARRRRIFCDAFEITAATRILDLGSEDGSNIAQVLAESNYRPENVYIADIEAAAIERGRERYGFNAVLIDESGTLPFEDGFFDIVYCSSVLEHVTVPKSEIWTLTSGKEFRSRALCSQGALAKEITRVGKRYFVQTPCRTFPIESHSWLPLVGMLPRRMVVPIFRVTNRLWVKKTIPDFYLMSVGEMRAMFPGSEIVREKSLALTKSIMAVSAGKLPVKE